MLTAYRTLSTMLYHLIWFTGTKPHFTDQYSKGQW